MALRDAAQRTPLLLLMLGSAPPLKVEERGKLSIADAISLYLESVLGRIEGHAIATEQAAAKVADVVCWTTWHEVSTIVASQQAALSWGDPFVDACLARLADSIISAVERHGG